MTRDYKSIISKGNFLFLLFSILAIIVFSKSINVDAFNEKRSKFSPIKIGKTNNKLKFEEDYDTLIYNFEVKDYSKLLLNIKTSNVTGDILIRVTYSSYESSSLIKEVISPIDGKIAWTSSGDGLFSPGEYYLIISKSENSVLSEKFSVKVNTENVKISDRENNNAINSSQYQAIDGVARNYYLAKLTPWGIGVDDLCDCVSFNLYEKGIYICIETPNLFSGRLRMELHRENDSDEAEFMYDYDITKTLKLNLRELPQGKYFLRFVWNDSSTEEKSFLNSQLLYKVTLAPYLQLENAKMSSKKVVLGLKGNISSTVLNVKASPDNVALKPLVWKSSNSDVVTVTSEGTIKAISVGKATISCTVEGVIGGSKTCKCDVEVKKQTVTINQKSVTMDKGKTSQLKVSVSPKESVTWYSDDKSIVTIDKKGKIKAIKAGTTTVYAKSKSGVKSSLCKVTVKDPISEQKNNNSGITNKPNDNKTTQGNTPQNDSATASNSEIVLKAGVSVIDVGFKTKITRTGGADEGEWSVSDCLEVVSSDKYSVTVRGIKAGNATVTFVGKGQIKSILIKVE